MNFDNLAVRIVNLDDTINLFQSHDPAFVERRLIPRRARAWATFRSKFSTSCSSADAWEFVGIITRGVQ
jgi:hypothetical protein